MPPVRKCLRGDGKRIRIAGEKIEIHVVARSDAGGDFLARGKRVAGVPGDAALIDVAYRVEHWVAIFVDEYRIAYSIANHAKANTLRLQRSGVWFVVIALYRGVVHEI